jgi:hypothetical protein
MNTIKAMVLVAVTFAVYITMIVVVSNLQHHHGRPIMMDTEAHEPAFWHSWRSP